MLNNLLSIIRKVSISPANETTAQSPVARLFFPHFIMIRVRYAPVSCRRYNLRVLLRGFQTFSCFRQTVYKFGRIPNSPLSRHISAQTKFAYVDELFRLLNGNQNHNLLYNNNAIRKKVYFWMHVIKLFACKIARPHACIRSCFFPRWLDVSLFCG